MALRIIEACRPAECLSFGLCPVEAGLGALYQEIAFELGDGVYDAHGLRACGKVSSHLFSFNVGLKLVPRERRRARDRTARLIAFLDAMSASADGCMKDVARLSQARVQMERRLRGRRASSSLPAVIDLVLTRPVVSAAMIAKAASVTPRAALTLIGELGVREVTGRGRYRAWGII